MNTKELIRALREDAEWAKANEWETPITLGDNLEAAAGRLEAYEDTGLTPSEVAEYKKFEDEAVSKGVTFARIVELMNADKDGRVVILPCKVGDYVVLLDRENGSCHECEVDFVNVGRSCRTVVVRSSGDGEQYGATFSAFGKTVFLTREEAEAALKEMKKDG